MPYINLIQDQRIASRSRESQARLALFGFAAIAGIAFMIYAMLFARVVLESGTLNRTEDGLTRLKPSLAQIDSNKKAEADLTPRLQSLQDAQAMTDRWTRILNHLSVQTPPGVWITSLRSTAVDVTQPVAVVIVGAGTDQAAISEFTLRTQNQPDLDNVELKYTEEQKAPTGISYQFEIDATIKGTEPPKAVAMKP